MKKWKIILSVFALSVACRKPYNPKVIGSPKSYLVVEGAINSNDTTTIKLSRTVNLSSSITSRPVEASINIESDNGDSYGLFERSPGIYITTGIVLDNARKYRLHITTQDNNEYRSDFVPVKNAPPIDSIGYNLTDKGLQIYSNTHDAADNTHYYRFNYTETWEFHSNYGSEYKSNGVDNVQTRPASEQIYFCYKSNISSNILLGSTAKLSHDVLFQNPVIAIESTSEKIEIRYSILLHQYALTAEGYKFWESLRKNTEQLGSIFDAEPTQLSGNIHNIHDDSDIVIGYISAGAVSTKRVFIENGQLPANWSPIYPFQCSQDSNWYDNPHTHLNDVARVLAPGIEIPTSAIYAPGNPLPVGYLGSDRSCADCTIRGTTKIPDFWKK